VCFSVWQRISLERATVNVSVQSKEQGQGRDPICLSVQGHSANTQPIRTAFAVRFCRPLTVVSIDSKTSRKHLHTNQILKTILLEALPIAVAFN
jgi:hypothetical protein